MNSAYSAGRERRQMGADHTLQLMLDANTNVLTAMYVPPPAPHPDAADSGSAAPAQDAEALSLIHI